MGDVDAVDPGILERLLAEDLVPVVATIGADQVGQAYNINADTAAGALAAGAAGREAGVPDRRRGHPPRPGRPDHAAPPGRRSTSSTASWSTGR